MISLTFIVCRKCLPLFVLFLSLSSPILSQTRAIGQNPPPSPTFLTETPYTIGPGDRLQVNLYNVKEFSGDYLVLVDGTVAFPLVGQMNVTGMTLNQLNRLLTDKYAVFIKRPVVTTTLLEPRPLKVTIAGEIDQPGAYTLAFAEGKFPTLTDLVQLAGGVTTVADIEKVQIRRQIGKNAQNINVSLWEILQSADGQQNLTLRDGDAIIIPTIQVIDPRTTALLTDANFGIRADQELNIAIVGEVFRPGSYKLSPTRSSGTDQTKQQPLRLTNAIQAAGGIKQLADIREVEVRRYTRTGQVQILRADLFSLLSVGDLAQDIVLQNGDVITVPTAEAIAAIDSETLASASFSPETIKVNVVGEVRTPGIQELRPNTPLNQALLAAGNFDKRRAKQKSVELIRLNDDGTVTRREIAVDFSKDISSENNPVLRNNDVIVVNRSGLTAATDTLINVFSPIGALTGVFSFFNIFGLFDNN